MAVASGLASAVNGGASRTDRFEQRVGAMFADCLQAFQAFNELAELAENLRVLSLNAELAAGRAGDNGRAVRALTQYTRELVTRLTQVQTESAGLMAGTYGQTAQVLRALHHLQLLERAVGAIAVGGVTGQRLAAGRDAEAARVDQAVSAMVGNVQKLLGRTNVVAEIVSASDSIATNIAIEAAAAGVHEMEFRTVAETMRRYVEQLREMIEGASGAVRGANEKGAGLLRTRLEKA